MHHLKLLKTIYQQLKYDDTLKFFYKSYSLGSISFFFKKYD